MNTKSAGYLSMLFNRAGLDQYIQHCNAALQWFQSTQGIVIDAFAVTGVSGIAVGSVVAHMCNKRLIVVRKHDDRSTHSCHQVEGIAIDGSSNNYIFFDDLISSGFTVKYTIAMIENCSRDLEQEHACTNQGLYSYYFETGSVAPKRAHCVGAMTYDRNPIPKCTMRKEQLPGLRSVTSLNKLATQIGFTVDDDLFSPRNVEVRDRVLELLPEYYTLIG